jgi:histidine triad (HIT) family protein
MMNSQDAKSDCLFCKIIAGQIPSRKVYEDDDVFAFHDIHPAAPVHFLMVPKRHLDSLNDANADHERILGKMLVLAPKLALEQGAMNGFRSVINTGPDGAQEVYHLHMHVMGGPRPWQKRG